MSKAAASTSSPVGGEVVKTGREVDVIVQALLRHAADADEGVRAQLAFAVHAIGLEQPLLAVSSLAVFLARNVKLEQAHRVVLLRMLAQLLETQTARDAIEQASQSAVSAQKELLQNLVKYCAKEMTQAAEAVTDISVPCSTCLVLLSNVDCSLVVEELMSLFPAGQLPHYYIVKTLADVAAAEPVAFVQKLKEVMARMTPVIGGIKKSPMKWVFATAYGRFSEAMGHYQAHALETGTDAPITSASFEIHMASAFDVMFNSWLPEEKEAKVRFACLESLGHMCLLLDRPALEMRLPKLIPAYLAMYRKEKAQDHISISHGLVSTLKEGVKSPLALTPLLPSLLMALHPLVSRPVDFAFPSTAKNHNELLRCFEILARFDLEATLQFVIGRFQLKERESRLGSLLILRHYVNSMDAELEEKKPTLMAAVLTLLGENDLLLRKTILQLIVSMANQQYLSLEGGQNIIRFILQQCAMVVEGEDKDGKIASAGPVGSPNASAANKSDATPLQIRNAGNHILGVMASKVPSTHRVLWPYLLELIVDPEFSRAVVQIFKVLDLVATVKREEQHPDYIINWEAQVNMPPPQALLCRMMILACEPFRRGEAGMTMCRAMASLGPIIHPSIGKYFDESAPSLIAHLESHTVESLNVSKWQDTLLKMFKETISLVDSAKWMQDLAAQLGEQFKLYKNDPALQRCVHRYLGAVLARVESRATLQSSIDLMLNTVNHSSDVERQGCAQGLGLAASVHLDVVLPKLTERLAPKVPEKKSTGFFASFSSSNDANKGPDDKLASTIALCYGYVAAYANPELIISRLDVHILHNILPLLPKARSTLLKVHLIKAIDLVGKAVHSSRLPETKKNWKLAQRDELLTGLCSFLDEKVQKAQQAKPSLEVKLLGVNALATLASLDPPISPEMRKKVTEAVFPFYGLNAAGEIAQGGGWSDAKSKGSSADANKTPQPPASSPKESPKSTDSVGVNGDGTAESGEGMLELIVSNLHTLLQTLINMEPTVSSLVDLLRLLDPWISSVRTVERERASASALVVLKKFVSKCVHEKVAQTAKFVPDLGVFLATILVRTNDSSLSVRQSSTENVQALLYIDQVLRNPDNPRPVQEIKLITDIRNRLESETRSDERLTILRDLCSLLTAIVGVNDLMVLEENLLLKGMLDSDLEAAQGAALIFKTLLWSKASEMSVSVRAYTTGLLAALKALRVGEVAEIAQASLRILARVHFNSVVAQLLESPVPLPREVVDAVTSLVETGPTDPSQAPVRPVGMEPEWDLALAERTLEHYITVLNETPLEKDKPTPVLQNATQSMAAMLKVESLRPLIEKHYAPILCTLLMRVGTAAGHINSSIDACGGVRAFLQSQQEDALLKKLDESRVWPLLEQEAKYDDGMTSLTRAVSEVHPERKRSLLGYLSKFFSQQSYTGQRIVATSMLAEFVQHSGDDVIFLREVIRFLLPRVADKVNKVRKQALRGLGHLVTVWNEETSAMASSVLSSLTAAAEDADADVAAEAVLSLTRIVGVVNEQLIGPMLVSICFRLRPAFDRKEELVRARSFTLFGALARFGSTESTPNMDEGVRGNFIDQLHTNVPIFLVHTNDAVETVRVACLDAFRALGPLLGEETVPVLAEASGEPSNYDELVLKLVPLLNQLHPDRLRGALDGATGYFTSVSTSLRGNAAFLAGALISSASAEQRKQVSIPNLTSELIKLMDDPQASVRSRAAKALSMCHHV